MSDLKKITAMIPAGALFFVSSGEYSDYGVSGIFRALKDIDADKLRAEWLVQNPGQADGWGFSYHKFLGSLFVDGYFEPLDAFEFYMGGYGDAEEIDINDSRAWTPPA